MGIDFNKTLLKVGKFSLFVKVEAHVYDETLTIIIKASHIYEFLTS